MTRKPITHLILETSSSNEHDNGDCDYCLIPVMTPGYVSYLLGYMDEVRRLHRVDIDVYGIECWDSSPRYFRSNDKLETLRDIDGNLAGDVSRGEPILLTGDPQFDEDDFQRVECQTVQTSNDDVWWTAYVKHTNIRIESAHVEKKKLLRIQRSLGYLGEQHRRVMANVAHPAIQRIHDMLYLDLRGKKQFYSAAKQWDADTLDRIAEIVAQYIPRPLQVESQDR